MIVFDPYFVMYDSLTKLVGGVPVLIDTYPDFKIDVNKVAEAITPRTKVILFNSPANPTGVVATQEETRQLAELAAEKNIALLSDEIYNLFCYDEEFISPARYNDRTIVIEGFSKSHAMTGWRLGWVHGPREIVDTMLKLQQYTFVCAPQPAQWAGAAALECDMQSHIDDYRRKRDRIYQGLAEDYEVEKPGGAFYIFPRAPRGMTGEEFVAKAIENNMLIIPGKIFSGRNSHFRVSYAASDAMIERGLEVFKKLAK